MVERVFHQVDPSLKVEIKIADGKPVKKNDIAMLVSGNVRSILKSERVALNFIQRMSGIATTTAKYVAKVKGMNVDIADTRKTTPVLRLFEKYSVAMGGGRNHRMDLNEAVLIKDNHFAALRALGLTYKEIIVKAKRNAPAGIVIEAETTTLQEVEDAVEVGVNIIMLDNMSLDDMKSRCKVDCRQSRSRSLRGSQSEDRTGRG